MISAAALRCNSEENISLIRENVSLLQDLERSRRRIEALEREKVHFSFLSKQYRAQLRKFEMERSGRVNQGSSGTITSTSSNRVSSNCSIGKLPSPSAKRGGSSSKNSGMDPAESLVSLLSQRDREIMKLKGEVTDVTGQNGHLHGLVENLNIRLVNAQKENDEKEAVIEEVQRRLFELEEELVEQRKRKCVQDQSFVGLQAALSSCEAELRRKDNELREFKRVKRDLTDEIDRRKIREGALSEELGKRRIGGVRSVSLHQLRGAGRRSTNPYCPLCRDLKEPLQKLDSHTYSQQTPSSAVKPCNCNSAENKGLKQRILALESELSNLQSRSSYSRFEEQKKSRKEFQTLQKDYEQLKASIETQERNLKTLLSDLTSADRKNAEYEKRNKELQQRIADLTTEKQHLAQDYSTLQAQLQMVLETQEKLKEIAAENIARSRNTDHNLDCKENELKALLDPLKISEEKVARLTSDSNGELEPLSEVEKRQFIAYISGIESQKTQLNEECRVLENEVKRCRDAISAVEKDLNACREQNISFQNDLASVRELLVAVDADKKRLTQSISAKEEELREVKSRLESVNGDWKIALGKLETERNSVKKLNDALEESKNIQLRVAFEAEKSIRDVQTFKDLLAQYQNQLELKERELQQLRNSKEKSL